MKKIFALILGIVLILSLCSCSLKRYPTIEAEQVESIFLWEHTSCWEMDPDQSEKFLKLYNRSWYKGKGTGEGGTPGFGVKIHFVDGAVWYINDFQTMGRDFEVGLFEDDQRKAWFYLNNQALLDYLIDDLGAGIID